MWKNGVLVIVGFLLAFTGGYFFLGQGDISSKDSPNETTQSIEEETEEANTEDLAAMIPDEAMSLSRNGCLSCHAVEAIDAPGGNIGPDLSRAFPEMKDKHGKELDDFLKDPTSAVMATIIADKPLKDDERAQIVKVLEEASKKLNSSKAAVDESNATEEDKEADGE